MYVLYLHAFFYHDIIIIIVITFVILSCCFGFGFGFGLAWFGLVGASDGSWFTVVVLVMVCYYHSMYKHIVPCREGFVWDYGFWEFWASVSYGCVSVCVCCV